jgi:hypothetical protein
MIIFKSHLQKQMAFLFHKQREASVFADASLLTYLLVV